MRCLQKKEDPKKKVYERGSVTIPDEPLDDPVAEKRRQQQYVPQLNPILPLPLALRLGSCKGWTKFVRDGSNLPFAQHCRFLCDIATSASAKTTALG